MREKLLLLGVCLLIAAAPPNSAVIDNAYVYCRGHWEGCHSAYEIDVGSAWTHQDQVGGKDRQADAHHDSNDCGSVTNVYLDGNQPWIVPYLGKVTAHNFNAHPGTYSSLTHVYTLRVWRYHSTNCTGTAQAYYVDYDYVRPESGHPSAHYAQCQSESYADCSGAYGDPSDGTDAHCSRIDLKAYQTNPMQDSNSFYIEVQASVGGDSLDHGCINVVWDYGYATPNP